MDDSPKIAEPGSRLPVIRYEERASYMSAGRRPSLDGFALACGLSFVFGIACALLLAAAPLLHPPS